MSFNEIRGQERAKQMLRNGLRNNKLSHAYIFSGPEGTGRRQMARKLAQALYCTECADDACGQCLACRKVEHGNHPDFHWIEPEGSSIKIEQIRELQKDFSYRSAGSGKKMYVLNQADRMTVQAANSLLKFLEEPLSEVVAVLIAENGQALLPTIQSRAQWVPFVPPNALDTADLLKEEGLPASLVLAAVRITAGVEAAKELVRAEWFAEARNVVIQLAKEAATALPAALISVQQKVFKTELAERLPTLLDLMILWFKDLIHIQYGRKEQLVYIDQADWLARHALTRGTEDWVRCMDSILETQKRLRFNANPQLAVEKLLTDLQGG
jgi:DNA polymerase-3 subunit delta'